ncbi:iron ABC transporter ATP-binding protein [Agromyces seonyuensis]|uniref:Iron ABC transporter ATP-binding protein n=1 Tax=Agromyces seonyuensis TaxID=2662446 RepID=A0A6I4P196_9MICO|nr:iron ABC transporter ATP-binding protein [Agromyces seonyuensis]MWC00142.1 iron ABC transporter ATP-binding protein [Agromyces seonyuensis]
MTGGTGNQRSIRMLAGRSILVVGLVAALAGCGAGAGAEPGESLEPTGPATPHPTAAETPEPPAPEPTETPAAYAVDCDALLSADQLYEYNSNYGVDPEYAPISPEAAQAAALGGTACGWSNQTSGAVVEVAAATPTASQLEALRADAATGTAVPEWGEGTFAVVDGIGTAQVFDDGRWIVVSSGDFLEPADANALVKDVLAGA